MRQKGARFPGSPLSRHPIYRSGVWFCGKEAETPEEQSERRAGPRGCRTGAGLPLVQAAGELAVSPGVPKERMLMPL